MTPGILNPDELAVLEEEYSAPIHGDIHRLFAHIHEQDAARRALVADNAALMNALRTIEYVCFDGKVSYCYGCGEEAPRHSDACTIGHALHGAFSSGSALLSEMEVLRKRVAELESKNDEWAKYAHVLESERDEARAQVATARDAALEEAAIVAQDNELSGEIALIIREYAKRTAQ